MENLFFHSNHLCAVFLHYCSAFSQAVRVIKVFPHDFGALDHRDEIGVID